MGKFNQIYSVIVAAQNANLTAHTYTSIVGGTGGCVIKVNEVIVNVPQALTIDIMVKSISGGTGCYLLGDDKNVYLGSPNAGF